MKKLVSLLSTVSLSSIGVLTLVSCTPKEPYNVIFEIDANVSQPSNNIAKTYQNAIDDFNKLLELSGKTDRRVEIRLAPKYNIQTAIFANNEAKPSLYLSYPDAATQYETLTPEGTVVDMREVIDWDEEWIKVLEGRTSGQTEGTTPAEKKAIVEYNNIKDFTDEGQKKNADSILQGKSVDEAVESVIDMDNTEVNTEFGEDYRPLTYSMLSENQTATGKLYVASAFKSVMYGMMNKRIIAEVVYLASGGTIDLGTKQLEEAGEGKWNVSSDHPSTKSNKFKMFDDNGNPNDRYQTFKAWFKKEENSKVPEHTNNGKVISAYANQDTSTLINTWFSKVQTPQDVAYIFQDADKLLVLSHAYSQICKFLEETTDFNPLSGWQGEGQTAEAYYSIGVDDMAGFVYTVDRNHGGAEIEDKTNPDAKVKAPYSWSPADPKKFILNDETGTNGIADIGNMFEFMKQERTMTGDGIHPGGWYSKPPSGTIKSYTSDFFVKGTVMVSMGSTAGVHYNFKNKQYEDDKGETILNPNDIFAEDGLPVAAPAFYRDEVGNPLPDEFLQRRSYGIQQGPGIGMFKNPVQEKNDISVAFMNYLLQSQNLGEYARKAGYIPSTYYSYFNKDGTRYIHASEEDIKTKVDWKDNGSDNPVNEVSFPPGTSNLPYYQNFGVTQLIKKVGKNSGKEWYEDQALINGDQALKLVVDQILDSVEAEYKTEANTDGPNNTTMQDDITQDIGTLYSNGPSPFGDTMRNSIIGNWVSSHYAISGANDTPLSLDSFYSQENYSLMETKIKYLNINYQFWLESEIMEGKGK